MKGDTAHKMLVDGILSRNGRLSDNPPPGPKWKAIQGLASLGLNAPCHDVMVCLIFHANINTGLCYPSEHTIAAWTRRPLRTVERAVTMLAKKGFVSIERKKRNKKTAVVSNYYELEWKRLFDAYNHQERSARSGGSLSPPDDGAIAKSGGSLPPKSGGSLAAKSGGVTIEVEQRNNNKGHEVASASAKAKEELQSGNGMSLEQRANCASVADELIATIRKAAAAKEMKKVLHRTTYHAKRGRKA
jgi:hypothetical protein